MDKEVAKSLIFPAVAMDAKIASMFSEVERIADEGQRERFKKSVGDLMG